MKLMLALYFFILALIQAGLLVGIYHYYRKQNIVKPSPYWMSSLLISVFALLIFGGGVLTVSDIARPQFSFTVANTLFVAAAIFQGLFCKSLNQQVTRREVYVFGVGLLIFAILFEVMRHLGTFEMRTIVMASLAIVLYGWQIMAIRKRRSVEVSVQLQYLQYATIAELFLALSRIGMLIAQSYTIRDVEQIPQFLILVTISQFVMNTLSYIAIGGYWSERISISNIRSQIENREVKELLLEREALIKSLLKANKTVATGALSASIAHELNQPLAASSLNIQFLQKRLADGDLSPTLQKEILDTLLLDNQRAANIIQSLKAIFSDQDVQIGRVSFAQLIDSVITILKPELIALKIQLVIDVDTELSIQGNADELRQVVLNLLGNSIQALSSVHQTAKFITIRAKYVSEGVELSVVDNGPGVSATSQAQLFDLLAGNKSQGMGLGLWLCKHIISRHGGKIFYRNSERSGAEFVTILPMISPL